MKTGLLSVTLKDRIKPEVNQNLSLELTIDKFVEMYGKQIKAQKILDALTHMGVRTKEFKNFQQVGVEIYKTTFADPFTLLKYICKTYRVRCSYQIHIRELTTDLTDFF